MIPILTKAERQALLHLKGFAILWHDADAAGIAAGEAITPQAMIVTQRANPMDDNSKVVQQYHIASGVCGFAWLELKGNTAFGKWLKQSGTATKGYPTGLTIWCRHFGQSMERKMAWSYAAAAYLKEHGQIAAHPCSRMD